jgi:hypothetical protein
MKRAPRDSANLQKMFRMRARGWSCYGLHTTMKSCPWAESPTKRTGDQTERRCVGAASPAVVLEVGVVARGLAALH